MTHAANDNPEDLSVYEAQARGMATIFGLDPDRPCPEDMRRKLQASGALKPEVWALADDAPAWRILARELHLTRHLRDDDW